MHLEDFFQKNEFIMSEIVLKDDFMKIYGKKRI